MEAIALEEIGWVASMKIDRHGQAKILSVVEIQLLFNKRAFKVSSVSAISIFVTPGI